MIPGDRVRVTAGDWCGETGTVIGAEVAGSVTLKLIDLDTGQRLGITPDRLTPIGSETSIRLAVKPFFDHVKRAMNAFQDDFTLTPPQDPRARALWAREHRNTGPDRSQYKRRGMK